MFELTKVPRYRIVAQASRQSLVQVGPLIPGSWSRHDDELGRAASGQFLLDTGAYGAMVDLEVAESLQFQSQGLRELHGIHGYGRLAQFLGQIALPAWDCDGHRAFYTATVECVGVPDLRDQSREQGVEIIGILGRIFLRDALLTVDGVNGTIELELGVGANSGAR